MYRKLMIHTVRPGDLLTMVGPDGAESEPFVLAEVPTIWDDNVWVYREYDAPIVVERLYGLDATFLLHHRVHDLTSQHRTTEDVTD